MKVYDLVFFTNSPTFYKINLINEVAKECSVFVFFLGYTKGVVNVDLKNNPKMLFDYEFLYNDYLINRNKAKVFFKLWKSFSKIKAKKVIYTGWYLPEYMISSFFISKHKNCVQCESAIFGSSFSSWKGWLKKIMINRMSTALVSGQPHKEIFTSLNFKGNISITGGVGIFNKSRGRPNFKDQISHPPKYLYVGRLSEEKNLEFLIDVFNENGRLLSLVGQGVLESKLKKRAKNNISFEGFIDNEKLPDVFVDHDIFIFPSNREPWGLALEEAIYNGLPAIVSNKVGSSIDLVKIPITGCVFEFDNEESLNGACDELEQNFGFYMKNVSNFSFEERDNRQIKTYVQLVK